MIKVSDYIVNFIKEQGVKDIFLLPGGGCIHIIDSIGKSDLNFICNLHEQACSIAAEAYSQYTNNLGVCLVTSGPGGTNAITGLASAWLDSIPVLFLSGQVQSKDMIGARKIRQMGFQELNIIDIVRPITKYAHTVYNPLDIEYHLKQALHLAKTGRPGPVWLDVPLDIQSAVIDENDLLALYAIRTRKKTYATDFYTQGIINSINESTNPVILAGNGIRLSGAVDKFLELCDVLQIPVLTTWKAADFLEEDHPLFIGRPGGTGQRGANFAQQNSDLILSIGARLDYGQTAYQPENFAKNAVKIVVDIDKSEILKLNTNIDYAVESDAEVFIETLLNRKDEIKTNCKPWLKKCKEWQKKYPVVLPEYEKESNVNIYTFVDKLSDMLPENSNIVLGSSGSASEITLQAFKVKKGQRIINSPGLGSMGFGLPAAIGVCVASGKKETICIEGDGSFAMNIQELETIYRENLPIKIFVLNNNGYASIRRTQENHFDGRLTACDDTCGLTLPNIRTNANAYRLDYFRIWNNTELKNTIKRTIESPISVICEVMISPNQKIQPRVSVYKKEDGSFAARPIEDMEPLLDRGEFNENMINE